MAIRPVVIYGNPVLHRPAAPVTAFDDEFKALVTDMKLWMQPTEWVSRLLKSG